jgi:toxin-antitoxin system PIN domain toxin
VTYLLDINVLIALFDPAHVHHEAAHRWLRTLAAPKWASCPLTQNGFVRILTNPVYPNLSVSPAQLVQRLRVFCEQPGHVFWPDAVSLTDVTLFDSSKLSGHRQVSDLYLAGLAMHFGGHLATFDNSVPVQALVKPSPDLIAVVPTV